MFHISNWLKEWNWFWGRFLLVLDRLILMESMQRNWENRWLHCWQVKKGCVMVKSSILGRFWGKPTETIENSVFFENFNELGVVQKLRSVSKAVLRFFPLWQKEFSSISAIFLLKIRERRNFQDFCQNQWSALP